MKRTQIYLDVDLWKLLHKLAEDSDSTVSELVRRAVREKYDVAGARTQRAAI